MGVKINKLVGQVFESTKYGKFEVLEYQHHSKIKVMFLETGFTTYSQHSKVIHGQIKDHLQPSVFGVGVTGGITTRSLGGKTSLNYNTWIGMLERCYSERYQQEKSTYKDCSVSENFKYFPYFKDWCEKQVGFGNKGWHLDKDIIKKGNKVYSEDACCFVPQEVNCLITLCGNRRGEYPIGVSYDAEVEKFAANIAIAGKNKRLGRFDTYQDAFYVYKEAKESRIKEVADKWKDQIDVRAYEALMNWKIEITD